MISNSKYTVSSSKYHNKRKSMCSGSHTNWEPKFKIMWIGFKVKKRPLNPYFSKVTLLDQMRRVDSPCPWGNTRKFSSLTNTNSSWLPRLKYARMKKIRNRMNRIKSMSIPPSFPSRTSQSPTPTAKGGSTFVGSRSGTIRMRNSVWRGMWMPN